LAGAEGWYQQQARRGEHFIGGNKWMWWRSQARRAVGVGEDSTAQEGGRQQRQTNKSRPG